MFFKLNLLSNSQKTAIATAHDLVMATLSFLVALYLKTGSIEIEGVTSQDYFLTAIILIGTQCIIFHLSGLYKRVWRYSSTGDLLKIIKTTAIAVPVSFTLIFLYSRLMFIHRSIIVLDWIILIMSLGGGRLFYRMVRDKYLANSQFSNSFKPAIIIGAGAGGNQLFREIKNNPGLNILVVGFLDDDPRLKKKFLYDIPVLGSVEDAPQIIKDYNIEEVFIAIPSASSKDVKKIYEAIRPSNVEVKILPKISKILREGIKFSNLRDLKIEDLLGREEISLDMDIIKDMLTGRRVLVTGAGGSIGAELCNQISKFNPANLTAVDISELNCFELENRLKRKYPELKLHVRVGDVRNKDFIENLFSTEIPEVVLHAAAYKHVPLMEFNPYEAIQTNIKGTKVVSEAAIRHGVNQFVLISTDKAVNPTNIMGASKRVAEMVIQNQRSAHHATKLMTVRFGNVLGSSGSVIPLFKKQIARGGPVTVTHEDITRFFMSIPEATRLVLQAGALGKGGELFVLDMGDPVRIIDLAKEMISLSGLSLGEDIDIVYTGLRPGEKLYEEPLLDAEISLPTTHKKVKISKARGVPDNFNEAINNLINLGTGEHRERFIFLLKELIPEYKPYQSATCPKEVTEEIVVRH